MWLQNHLRVSNAQQRLHHPFRRAQKTGYAQFQVPQKEEGRRHYLYERRLFCSRTASD
jgi:hypothetical protein